MVGGLCGSTKKRSKTSVTTEMDLTEGRQRGDCSNNVSSVMRDVRGKVRSGTNGKQLGGDGTRLGYEMFIG